MDACRADLAAYRRELLDGIAQLRGDGGIDGPRALLHEVHDIGRKRRGSASAPARARVRASAADEGGSAPGGCLGSALQLALQVSNLRAQPRYLRRFVGKRLYFLVHFL